VLSVAPATDSARPYGIKLDREERPWVALFGTNKLARINPETMALREVELPRADARPRRLEIDRNGNVWYVDYAEGYLGRYVPATGVFSEWRLPGKSPRPYGTALDDRGHLWIADTGVLPNRILGFDMAAEKFFSSSPVPSGGNIRFMHFNPKDGSFWFGVDAGFLAQGQPQ